MTLPCVFKPFLLLLSLFFVCCLVQNATQAAPIHLYDFCGSDNKNTTEFAPNTTFQSNLNLLFSSLSSNATSSNNVRNSTGGFRNLTIGSSNDAIYGLFLCRGDVSVEVCRDCVSTATRAIVLNCNRVKSAITFYDECMLRYSNSSFFTTMNESPSLKMWNTNNVSDANRFLTFLGATMNEIKLQAVSDRSPPEKFATKVANYTGLQNVYTLAQCTPDISPEDCNRCLTNGIAQLPDYGSQGGRFLTPSCNIRYELYPFYNETADTEASPPPPAIRSPPRPPPPVAVSSSRGMYTLSYDYRDTCKI